WGMISVIAGAAGIMALLMATSLSIAIGLAFLRRRISIAGILLGALLVYFIAFSSSVFFHNDLGTGAIPFVRWAVAAIDAIRNGDATAALTQSGRLVLLLAVFVYLGRKAA
ncbi:MAG TPA: hypothetical protein VKS81_11430, partial [Bacteroidota bacterium]|nr:hypothetical protein [Bacteroidota bacterium]